MAPEKNKYREIERRKIQRRVGERRVKIRFKDVLGRRSDKERRAASTGL